MKPIYDITPFTALDFTNKLAAIIWFAGCNMRCGYCHNPHIVFGSGKIAVSEALDFLKKRVGLLDGVVLSGGEATLFKGLGEFCKDVKTLGFAVKLDTNGSSPDTLLELLKNGALDFVSLDFKSTKEKYHSLSKGYFYDSFAKSLTILINSNVSFEVRTTIHPALLEKEDILRMRDFLTQSGYKGEYFIQAYRHSKNIGDLSKPKVGWDEEFKDIQAIWR